MQQVLANRVFALKLMSFKYLTQCLNSFKARLFDIYSQSTFPYTVCKEFKMCCIFNATFIADILGNVY